MGDLLESGSKGGTLAKGLIGHDFEDYLCDKAGMTVDKFTLKTRGVYKAVSAMSAGFFCWMVWVMIEQNETSIIFFRPMLALAVISLIIFIDLITDRFSVNGTRVTRRRGLIVKKFDISEIESTRLKKGLFGEKIEFYVKGKCIAKVSTNNQPSQKVGYEDVWDLRNAGDLLESGSKGGTSTVQKVFTDNPFDEAGNLKPNIKYQTGEFKYNYETDANGRISNWNTDNLQLTERDG